MGPMIYPVASATGTDQGGAGIGKGRDRGWTPRRCVVASRGGRDGQEMEKHDAELLAPWHLQSMGWTGRADLSTAGGSGAVEGGRIQREIAVEGGASWLGTPPLPTPPLPDTPNTSFSLLPTSTTTLLAHRTPRPTSHLPSKVGTVR
jgi:hypothetical protein